MGTLDNQTTDAEEDFEDWPEERIPSSAYATRLYGVDEEPQGFATQTAFDNYFLYTSKPSRTSSNVFSNIVPPLSPEEYATAIARLSNDPQQILWQDLDIRKAFFARFFNELREGFNLLFYGYGSKRDILNAFARDLAKRKGHVVVANGFQPSFALKDLLSAIEQIPAFQASFPALASAAAGTSIEAQTQRIYDLFSAPWPPVSPGAGDLYLVLHNIDGPALRSAKAKSSLATLALCPRIHLVASIDHIGAPLRWTMSELFARKDPPFDPDPSSPRCRSRDVPRRGFAWLWHDLTTLAPYDFELAYADPTFFAGASANSRGGRAPAAVGPSGQGPMTESAARHILASVTQKARKLFLLLGRKQAELMDGETENPQDAAYGYERLFNAARDNFVATNDTALRALLAEFKDHGLVVSTAGAAGSAEALWIPMRRDALGKILSELNAEGL
ncbi:hypothetical protein AcV5_005634 [Taiwanofungus camphoratus]|nr:hypothetical protein AcV5_005634 [Antrodia cinnamomea]